MYTSYYAKYKGPNGIPISLGVPTWYKCNNKPYTKLNPPGWLLKQFKDPESGHYNDEDWYLQEYYNNVLKNLDPHKVYDDLGSDAVLLCWEAPGKFCHRHIVSQWLCDMLGIEITEI